MASINWKKHLSAEELKEYKRLKRQLKPALKPSRYEHTLGVVDTAAALALHHEPILLWEAVVAALLHDCAKCLSDEERLRICAEQSITVTEVESRFPQLLHGKVGAYLATSEYGIQGEAIAHAIAVHTTGCPDMSLLDEIIFVADYIEPGRDKAPRLLELRSLAYSNLPLCIYYILEDTVAYLSHKPKSMDPTTLAVLESYRNKLSLESPTT